MIEVREHLNQLRSLLSSRRDARAEARRHFGFVAAKRVARVVSVDDRGLRFLIDTTDWGVGRETFRHGIYEYAEFEYAVRLAERLTSRHLEGRVFVDIGANIGTTTIPAIRLLGASRAIAIEPSPANLALLRANILMNDVSSQVEVIAGACSAAAGTLELEFSDSNHGDHRIRLKSGVQSGEWREDARGTIPVPVITVDDVVASVDLAEIGLIWIDTQGHEGSVLEGARSVRSIPTVIEYWPYALHRSENLDRLHKVLEEYDGVINRRQSMIEGSIAWVARGPWMSWPIDTGDLGITPTFFFCAGWQTPSGP